MKLELDPHWTRHGATHAKGYAFVDGRLHHAAELAALFEACATHETWRLTLTQLNGNFAIVTRRGEAVWAGVDHVRSIPLFYGEQDDRLILSDRAEYVRAALNEVEQCPITTAEFRVTGYVTGPDTLFAWVKQLQAGELLSFDAAASPRLMRTRYFAWRHRDEWRETSEALSARLHDIHRNVARRLVESLGGRQAIVPLSGGYDSRLIAMMLKEQGYDNVFCYTYGLPDNWESKVSESLARHLGFRWEFVPYSGAKWREWGATDAFKQYCPFASNHTSIPHVQDWPAIYELSHRNTLSSDGVLVPGHTGDFLTGGHIPHWFGQKASISRAQLLQALFDYHYSLWDWAQSGQDMRAEFERRVGAIIGPTRHGTAAEAADQIEYWDMNERQAKFICNSVRVYDFFGLAWRTPLFDRELLDFWARVAMPMRVGRRLYFEYVDRYQKLPVAIPNQDRGPLAANLIKLANATGLRPMAKALQFRLRRNQWKNTYENCTEPPLAWFTLIDRELFRRTYTGRQTLHAYLARLGAEGAFRQDTRVAEHA